MRRRSMPNSRSFSHRTGALCDTTFDTGANRLPQAERSVDVAEQVRARRGAMPAPVVGQELALEPCDVDADGAFRLAGAALEAQIEHRANALVAEPGLVDAAGHDQAQDVGAPARRVRFLARRHVRRAHGPVERLAACTQAAAHLDGARQPAVLLEVEEGHRLLRSIRGAVAQIGRQRRRVDDLPGVEDAVRIERPLDRAGTRHTGPGRTSSP